MSRMEFQLTEEHVSEILHMEDASEWHAAMLEMFPEYEITTRNRVAGFLAQTAHESANYKVLSENLNYSAKALDAIFGKYFKRAGRDAKEYHRQPEKIANVIYANRMDNGDIQSSVAHVKKMQNRLQNMFGLQRVLLKVLVGSGQLMILIFGVILMTLCQ